MRALHPFPLLILAVPFNGRDRSSEQTQASIIQLSIHRPSPMASWDNQEVTDRHLLPYVDSATASPDVQAALQTLPFERNIFKVFHRHT